MSSYEWKDIQPMMIGNWQSAIQQINGLNLRDYHPKKHYSCPMCGGKDRFRFDDRRPKARSADGTGGYYCNACGSGDGMDLFVKLTGLNFSEAVNTLGKFLNAQPVEQRRAAQAIIHSAPRLDYGKEMSAEDAAAAMQKTVTLNTCPLTRLEGINPTSIRLVFRPGTNDVSNPDNWRLCVPVNRINDDGSIGHCCNVARIDINGAITFLAGDITYNAATYIQGNENIVLCERWADGWHIHHQTGATVMICYNPMNVDHVAYLLGAMAAGVAARKDDYHTIAYAEERNLMMWAMKGKKVVARTSATKILNALEAA